MEVTVNVPETPTPEEVMHLAAELAFALRAEVEARYRIGMDGGTDHLHPVERRGYDRDMIEVRDALAKLEGWGFPVHELFPRM